MPVRRSLAEFKQDCRRASDELDLTFQKALRTIILTIVERTAMRTPIATGQASSNWFVSTSRDASSMVLGPGSPEVSISRAEALKFADPYSVWFIYNNLPYIARLEYEGWSQQAPQGMLRVTMAEVAAELKNLIASGNL